MGCKVKEDRDGEGQLASERIPKAAIFKTFVYRKSIQVLKVSLNLSAVFR